MQMQFPSDFDSNSIQLPFESHSTAIRPRYDHSTFGLPVLGCCTAA